MFRVEMAFNLDDSDLALARAYYNAEVLTAGDIQVFLLRDFRQLLKDIGPARNLIIRVAEVAL
jgi:hypothetical protein